MYHNSVKFRQRKVFWLFNLFCVGFFLLFFSLTPALIREATYSTIRIGAYEPIKVHVFGATDRHHTPLLKKIGSGATSGRIETVHVNTFRKIPSS